MRNRGLCIAEALQPVTIAARWAFVATCHICSLGFVAECSNLDTEIPGPSWYMCMTSEYHTVQQMRLRWNIWDVLWVNNVTHI